MEDLWARDWTVLCEPPEGPIVEGGAARRHNLARALAAAGATVLEMPRRARTRLGRALALPLDALRLAAMFARASGTHVLVGYPDLPVATPRSAPRLVAAAIGLLVGRVLLWRGARRLVVDLADWPRPQSRTLHLRLGTRPRWVATFERMLMRIADGVLVPSQELAGQVARDCAACPPWRLLPNGAPADAEWTGNASVESPEAPRLAGRDGPGQDREARIESGVHCTPCAGTPSSQSTAPPLAALPLAVAPLAVTPLATSPVATPTVAVPPPDGALRFIYAGDLSLEQDRGVRGLVEAFRARARDGLELILAGEGGAWLEALEPVPGLRHLGPVPEPELMRWVRASHVGLIPYPPQGYYLLVQPTKLSLYAVAGLVVVTTPLPAAVRLVNEHSLGLVVEPGELPGIFDRREELLALSGERRRAGAPELVWPRLVRRALGEGGWRLKAADGRPGIEGRTQENRGSSSDAVPPAPVAERRRPPTV